MMMAYFSPRRRALIRAVKRSWSAGDTRTLEVQPHPMEESPDEEQPLFEHEEQPLAVEPDDQRTARVERVRIVTLTPETES